jgi:hypothetical protein
MWQLMHLLVGGHTHGGSECAYAQPVVQAGRRASAAPLNFTLGLALEKYEYHHYPSSCSV